MRSFFLCLPALLILAAGCRRSAEAVPASPSQPAPPPAPEAHSSATPPELAPGPIPPPPHCQADEDCAPLSPCGITEPDSCVPSSVVSPVVAECARPRKSLYRCACATGKCVTQPLSP